uniref:uncharacterized protein LOC120815598 n=1 Tax=Gasterosteus aculeatus aculeatus TaxID=481459 RepID=UPI001A99B26B|nr:uncharacterized protein LOC120815598 [Gasterosteus aculeatus aculeatus]
MATCIPFQTQLSSIMEVLVKAAVAEISKLVDDKCAFLHLEISRRQSENDALKRKLLLMENRSARPPRGFENYMDRGTDVGTCPRPAGDIKFSDVDGAAVSFTIKEESPDEMLWISDSAAPIGSAARYRAPANAAPSQRLEEGRQSGRSEAGDLYAGDIAVGHQFAVKTEKEEDRSAFGRGGCLHGAGKQTQLAADFSMDERENQLWSSIIEGGDIDARLPRLLQRGGGVFQHLSGPLRRARRVQRRQAARRPAAVPPEAVQRDLQQRRPAVVRLSSRASAGPPEAGGPPAEGRRSPAARRRWRLPPPQARPRRGPQLRLLALRQDVRPPAPVQAAPAEPQEEAGLLVHRVREELPVLVAPQHSPPDAHGREAVRLRPVRQEVHAAEQPEGAPADAQRRAALQLLAVREDLHPHAPPEAPPDHPHVQLRRLERDRK